MKQGDKGFILLTKGERKYHVPSVIVRINSKTVNVILLDDIPNSVYERGDQVTADMWDWHKRDGRDLKVIEVY